MINKNIPIPSIFSVKLRKQKSHHFFETNTSKTPISNSNEMISTGDLKVKVCVSQKHDLKLN